ncbi:MAG: hypothetical protein MR270_01565 [Erysipelotrichaceae bacterium]|nr:hypothetical protein [Erysipelotrichaceae bacterium]
MNVTIFKSKLYGIVNAPSSKSYAHRYLIAAMLAKQKCLIENVTDCDDVIATLNNAKNFNMGYKKDSNCIELFPLNNKLEEIIFECNESGSTLRFFIPVALALFDKVTFKGTKKLFSRGIDVYKQIAIKQNIKFFEKEDEITFIGKLHADNFIIPGNISSQYVTGLLFAMSILKNNSTLTIIPPIESMPYIDITLDVLSQFNIFFSRNENTFSLNDNSFYLSKNYFVEGDYSNAAFLDAFNYLNCNVKILNLKQNSLQGDKIYQEYFSKINKGNCIIDIKNCIDLGPVLFSFSSLKYGATFINTKRLQIKESNRILAMKEELIKVGSNVIIKENEVIVTPIKKDISNNICFNSHNDHRIVMALSLFSTLFDIKINGCEAVKKSYPNFFNDLVKLGAVINYDK